jgi:peptide deformylase
MKRFTFVILIFSVIVSLSCTKDALLGEQSPEMTPYQPFTEAETQLIMNGDTNEPMRILLTTNLQDSLQLREKSIDVNPDPNDPVLIHLIKRMYYTMVAEGGVGIAAPQVGIKRNLFWFKRFDILPSKPFQIAINPKINFYSQKKVNFVGDGCLSVPGISGRTERYSSILVQYYLESGLVENNILEGASAASFTSVCFQHEYDHLQGILFVDRVVSL